MPRSPALSPLGRAGAAAAIGAFSWSVTEYVMHRWVLHGPFGTGRLARVPIGGLHREHHVDPAATSLPARLAGYGALAVVAVVAAHVVTPRVPAMVARVAAATWWAGYGTYELAHWATHHRAPRTRGGLRRRERHFRHHFGAPASNLGVTIGLWDRVFGTEADAEVPAIPARHAPTWLVAGEAPLDPRVAERFRVLDG